MTNADNITAAPVAFLATGVAGVALSRDLRNLLNRAAAALETPRDMSEEERGDLIEDLVAAAKRAGPGALERHGPVPTPVLRPRVLVEVSGGVVQAVSADSGQPVDILIADYDTDGCDEGENGVVRLHAGPDPGLVSLCLAEIAVDASKVSALFDAQNAGGETRRTRERGG